MLAVIDRLRALEHLLKRRKKKTEVLSRMQKLPLRLIFGK